MTSCRGSKILPQRDRKSFGENVDIYFLHANPSMLRDIVGLHSLPVNIQHLILSFENTGILCICSDT